MSKCSSESVASMYPPLENTCVRIYLIRHGESEGNREHKNQGQTDSSLTFLGVRQAAALGQAIAQWDTPIDSVVSSDLTRCRMTISVALSTAGHGNKCADIRLDPRLREKNFGPGEERSSTSVFLPDVNYSKRERSCAERATSALCMIIEDALIEREALGLSRCFHVLVCAHGLVIHELIRSLFVELFDGASYEFSEGYFLSNTGFHVLDVQLDDDSLSLENTTCRISLNQGCMVNLSIRLKNVNSHKRDQTVQMVDDAITAFPLCKRSFHHKDVTHIQELLHIAEGLKGSKLKNIHDYFRPIPKEVIHEKDDIHVRGLPFVVDGDSSHPFPLGPIESGEDDDDDEQFPRKQIIRSSTQELDMYDS